MQSSPLCNHLLQATDNLHLTLAYLRMNKDYKQVFVF